MIKFECANCGQRIVAERANYGEESFCPSCFKELQVPFPNVEHPEVSGLGKWTPVVVFLRWIAVLPSAVLAYFIADLFVIALAHFWDIPRFLQDAYNCLFGSAAFIVAGMRVAPRHQFWTSIALSILFSSSLIAICFLDLYVPDLSVWRKIWAWACAAISIGTAIVVSKGALEQDRKK